MFIHLLVMLPTKRGFVFLSCYSKLSTKPSFIILLAVVLVHLLHMFPAHGGLVHPVVLDTKLATKSCLVVLLGVVFINLGNEVMSHCTFVHPVLLNSKLSSIACG